MLTRTDAIENDMFQQAYLDYRTFMKSATEFVDCYEALNILFKDHFQIKYEEGQWVIFRTTEFQYLPEGNRYYTLYDYTGAVIEGNIDTRDYATVGKNELIYPINRNQTRAVKLANKTVQHDFKYNTWDEIPRNNKFERGTQFNSGTALDETDLNDNGNFSEVIGTYKDFTISNWEFGEYDFTFGSFALTLPVTLLSTTKQNFCRRIYNNYGVELRREVYIEPIGTNPDKWLFMRSEGVPVNQGDIISISNSYRTLNSITTTGSSFAIVAGMYLVSEDGTTYYGGSNTDFTSLIVIKDKIKWKKNAWAPIYAQYNGEDSRRLLSYSGETEIIPINGTLYFLIPTTVDSATGGNYYSNFGVEYKPFVSGGFIPVKGDTWKRSQNNNYSDSLQTEVNISDSLEGIVKGTILDHNRVKTVTDWYRFGLGGSEIRAYKELVNLAMYNLTWRRFLKIEGDFNSLKFQPNNEGTSVYPLGFSVRYKFTDMNDSRLFCLVCPVQMDIMKGRFTGTFQEVYQDGTGDGQQVGDLSEFKYLFE